MDLSHLRNPAYFEENPTEAEACIRIVHAIEATYEGKDAAVDAFAELWEAFPQWEGTEGEPLPLTWLRHDFFEDLRKGKSLTLGELAAGAVLFSPEHRHLEYELESEDQSNEDPYNLLPRILLDRAEASQDRNERLALLKVLDGILGIWLETLEEGPICVDEDDFGVSILRQDTVREVEQRLVLPQWRALIREGEVDGRLLGYLCYLEEFLKKKAWWQERQKLFRHATEKPLEN